MKTTMEQPAVSTFSTLTPETRIVSFTNQRQNREWKTMEAMVEIYCREIHGATSELCSNCLGLLNYANVRLDRCRFGANKPTCAKCPVHCYQRERREQVRVVMHYAGARMLWEHPMMSLRHLLDGFRKTPEV